MPELASLVVRAPLTVSCWVASRSRSTTGVSTSPSRNPAHCRSDVALVNRTVGVWSPRTFGPASTARSTSAPIPSSLAVHIGRRQESQSGPTSSVSWERRASRIAITFGHPLAPPPRREARLGREDAKRPGGPLRATGAPRGADESASDMAPLLVPEPPFESGTGRHIFNRRP